MTKKSKTIASGAILGMAPDYSSPRLHIDFEKLAELAGLNVGDTVRILVKGKVSSLEQREGYDEKKTPMASICVKDFEAYVSDASSEFDSLLEDDDE